MNNLFRNLRLRMFMMLAIGCYWGLRATPVAAHEGVPLPPHRLMEMWDWESWAMAGLVLMAWLYSRGVRILWWRSGLGRVITVGQTLAFNGGLTVLFIAFVSPLHALSADLFIAHTVQHLLLILLATAMLFWRLLLLPQTDETLSPAQRLRFVVTIALAGTLLGVLITLTPPLWYPTYPPPSSGA